MYSYFYEHWGSTGTTILVILAIIFGIILCAVVFWLMAQLERFVKFIWRAKVAVGNRTVRIFSVPLVSLVAISLGVSYIEYLIRHSTQLFLIVPCAAIITLVWSLITCRSKGLWVGPLRILLGFLVFIAIATVVFTVLLFAGLALGLIGSKSSSPESIMIYRSGRYVKLKRLSDTEYIDESNNEQYTYSGSSVADMYGHSYDIK